MIPALLVSGGDYLARETAVAGRLAATATLSSVEVILEGLPSGQAVLVPTPSLHIQRIAPGCMCCIGNLAMRVTLNRVLRRKPGLLVISLASSEHLDNIRRFLTQEPYDSLLQLADEIRL
ncbi:GTPase [Undibacterium sp. TJN25]|uniref:GTPase n=1 Tax=Undibacterium sp. TJN25 TaxID=3413056 RepID=UPI003BEFD3F6